MTDIPRIIRFLDKLEITQVTQYDLLSDNYDKNDKDLRDLHKAISKDKDAVSVAMIYLRNKNKPIELTKFKERCMTFNCVDINLYHLLYIVSIMEIKPTHLMPRVFNYIKIPDQNISNELHDDQMAAIAFVVNQITNLKLDIYQINEFKKILPEYDRKNIIEKFIFMQFTQDFFYQMMRYFRIPILLETNDVYTMKKHNFSMTDDTFRQIAYILSDY